MDDLDLGWDLFDPQASGPLWIDTDFDRALKALRAHIDNDTGITADLKGPVLDQAKAFLSAYITIAKRFKQPYNRNDFERWRLALVSQGIQVSAVVLLLNAFRLVREMTAEVPDSIWNPASYAPDSFPINKVIWTVAGVAALLIFALNLPTGIGMGLGKALHRKS